MLPPPHLTGTILNQKPAVSDEAALLPVTDPEIELRSTAMADSKTLSPSATVTPPRSVKGRL